MLHGLMRSDRIDINFLRSDTINEIFKKARELKSKTKVERQRSYRERELSKQ